MSEENKGGERVSFSRGYDVCIMAIDGTWRRDCQLNAVSDNDATLSVEGSIQGLNLKEFFLLLSSTGLSLSALRAGAGQWNRHGHPVPQGQERQEETICGPGCDGLASTPALGRASFHIVILFHDAVIDRLGTT